MLLHSSDFQNNILQLQAYLKKENLDGCHLSGSTPFLTEYTPREETHRYYVTGFTGSTAEVIVPKSGKVFLFVDGRYHEQADREVDHNFVTVVKCPLSKSILQAMVETIRDLSWKKIAAEGDRISLAIYQLLQAACEVELLVQEELHSVISFKSFESSPTLTELPLSLTGESSEQKLKRLIPEGECFYVTSLDTISWLTNLRGYELPYQATFRARALAFSDHIYLLLPSKLSALPKIGGVTIITDVHEMRVPELLAEIYSKYNKPKMHYAPRAISAKDFTILLKLVSESHLIADATTLLMAHAKKNSTELEVMSSSIKRADLALHCAIFNMQKRMKQGPTSEADFQEILREAYTDAGVTALSFSPIVALGVNSSVIHYSGSDKNHIAKEGDLLLLDSGVYFEGGIATDCTRTILLGKSATQKQREIYTLVLRGLLNAQMAVFPEGASGIFADALARKPLYEHGYDFSHGTGHGVGINVHEGGIGISTKTTEGMFPNFVTSIEPGIYLPNFGGVRLENLAVVVPHPTLKGFCTFKVLTYVGFDHNLIDREMMTSNELEALDLYERECKKRGSAFL